MCPFAISGKPPFMAIGCFATSDIGPGRQTLLMQLIK